MVGISLLASKRIHTGEDYIVAGRNLSPLMTTATIMATWYAAETILVTADWVRTDGIDVMVLEPIGIGDLSGDCRPVLRQATVGYENDDAR